MPCSQSTDTTLVTLCSINLAPTGDVRPLNDVTSALFNCLTIDVEEYFDCEVFRNCVASADRAGFERRAAPCLERLAEMLSHAGSRGTFFVLGQTVGYLAPLLRQLIRAGHEIACHGDQHEHLARLDPQRLRVDLRRARARIEDALGVAPRGYRAPTFSVTRRTAWALDVIAEEGFSYDASIFPIRHDRYGVADAPTAPFWALSPAGTRVLEFPPLVLTLGVLRLPVGGGGYLRLLPTGLVRRCLAGRQRRGRPALLYVHPWELDPHQPKLPVGRLAQWRHRVNLHRTAQKLESLLRDFRFDTATAVLQRVLAHGALPVFSLA